jgi:hypothetical protein
MILLDHVLRPRGMELCAVARPILVAGQRRPTLLTLVIPHVLLQRVGVHITLVAVGAGKGLVGLVDTPVDVQPTLVDESLVALVATEGADWGVQLQVLLEVALDGEALAAVGTHEGVPVYVDPGVVLSGNGGVSMVNTSCHLLMKQVRVLLFFTNKNKIPDHN